MSGDLTVPFTPTHTLAAVPLGLLWSRPGVFSSLAIGCMVPDWPLYVPGGPPYDLTHSFAGILIACLPLGLGLALLYQAVLKRPLFELLPAPLGRRLARFLDGPNLARPGTLLAIAAAVALGAMTHVVWDAFTHRGAWGVALLPQLGEPLLTVSGVRIPGYAALQHGCTLFGLPLALLLFARWYRRAEQKPLPATVLTPGSRLFWTAILTLLPVLILGVMVIELLVPQLTPRGVFITLVRGVTRAGLAMLASIALYGAFFHLVRGRQAALRTGP